MSSYQYTNSYCNDGFMTASYFHGNPFTGKDGLYIEICICKLHLMWTCCAICNHTTCLVLCRLVESESIILIIVWYWHWRGIIIMCPVHPLTLCQILIKNAPRRRNSPTDQTNAVFTCLLFSWHNEKIISNVSKWQTRQGSSFFEAKIWGHINDRCVLLIYKSN